MAQFARSFLVLLTTVSALAAGVLNGRVVCVADAGHVAIEEPHPRTAHSPHDHGCAGSCGAGDERDAGQRAPDGNDADHHGAPPDHHGAPPAGDCTDIGPGETLVREVAPAAYGHEHVPLALPPVLAATLLATSPCPSPREHDGGPPSASGDLAALRSVILVI